MRILGIEIESKTDILAASAFILSLGGLLAQAAIILKGPRIELDGPKQVLIYTKSYNDGEAYVAIASKSSYVNTGSPSFSDILRSESAELQVEKRLIRFISDDFVDIDAESGKLVISRESSWEPLRLSSGDVATITTSFVPMPGENGDSSSFVDMKEFLSLTRKSGPSRSIVFRLNSSTFHGQGIAFTCRLRVGDFWVGLARRGWSAPLCRDSTYRRFTPLGDIFDRFSRLASGLG